ncbi:MAG: hypothetical protein R2754_00350 [Microthrixaceae bacterium]
MSEDPRHGDGPGGDVVGSDDDALAARIRAAAELIEPPTGAPVPVLRRRAQRRVRRRRGLAAAGSVAVVLAVAASATLLVGPNHGRVSVAEPVAVADRALGRSPGVAGEWTWRDMEALKSRTGKASGYGIREGAGDDLLVYLDESGVCLDGDSCRASADGFGANDLRRRFVARNGGPAAPLIGPGAPFAGWDVAVVPGITGDLHSGRQSGVDVPGGPAGQRFVGSENLDLVLAWLAEERPNTQRVVLAGSGSGGLATLLATPQVERVAGERLVGVIANGGAVPGSGQIVPSCVVRHWSLLWGVGYPDDWGDHVPDPSTKRLADLYPYLADRFPNVAFAQLSGTDDPTMRALFRTGTDQCDQQPAPVTSAGFGAGVASLDRRLANLKGWEFFLVDETTSAPLAPSDGAAAVPGFLKWAQTLVEP